ncbi:lysophospholipid acyltransferase LPCAT4 isoform X2 [Salmo salar]|uniref:Lysophospholipid acyltransferase LPCAT4 isoform X2 n=1 Tax=Salmo salar TaxID=8030 RepID=A0A1S3N8Y4_SALSA|nr:lysophospholipid acyltransferase LPCAT4-like isoform X2 [Salmo salar]|eukprot:XP_014011889.1 PREDICTED: lysophospholipid acyltransferase LPCAT4-like isoform X2 [Salmo salar]
MERQNSHQATYSSQHPFVHTLKLTRAQLIRGMVLGSILVPIRVFLAVLCFLIMWPIARLRLAGLSEAERSRPVTTGWRRWLLHPIIWFLSRAVFFFLGFFWVRVKGCRAGCKEAPVLAVAPHSSFLDMLVLTETQLPAVVSRSENQSIPVIGALLEFNQSVLVNRKDPESRKRAVVQIKERLISNGYWPQMLMFPEGTTTNGTSLIKFKPGAFLAGVPVQPVLLHYPNKLDTVRWTHRGTTWVEALWHTCSQLYTNVTVEYLPVYTPSQEEKDDPNLYADNVQKLMAKTLGIPATDHVMEGRVPTRKLGGLSLPLEPPARETLSLLHKDGLRESEVEAALSKMIDRCQSEQGWRAGVDELAPLLGLTDRQTAAKICGLYSKDDMVDLRQIYLSVTSVSGLLGFKSLLHTAFTLYDRECSGSLTAVDVSDLMGALVGSPQYHTEELYTELSLRGAPTEQDLFRVLTTHPTYQKLISEYFTPGGVESTPPSSPLTKGKAGNNNAGSPSDNRTTLPYKTADNGSPLPSKKND